LLTRGLDQKVVHPYLPSHIRSKYKKNTATPYWNHGANLKATKKAAAIPRRVSVFFIAFVL
ncbi:MAG: hypothetical protein IJ714_00625, partial [Bacteroidales bacterium]|nr:hypothetical protein [Bacteroidales bacterium]